ncbi:hypothetical protein WSS_A32405, partial [Rhodococcus opacus M213]
MAGEDQYALFEFDDTTADITADEIAAESESDDPQDVVEEVSTPEPPQSHQDVGSPPVWEALPAGEDADGHALIVTA